MHLYFQKRGKHRIVNKALTADYMYIFILKHLDIENAILRDECNTDECNNTVQYFVKKYQASFNKKFGSCAIYSN